MLMHKILLARPEPLDAAYQAFNDDAVYAEQLGFDFAMTSEHHFSPDAWSPSQMPILANIAGRTSTLELGTAVYLTALHHPIRTAEDLATVDLLSHGRLTGFAVGSGSIEDEFQTFGIDASERFGRLWESLEIIRRCFTEDHFDHKGKYFDLPNIRMTTRPVQEPFPLWVGAYGPKMVERAGREGYHLDGGRDQVEKYLSGLRASGYDPEAFNQRVFSVGHLSDSREKAWDECQDSLHAWQAMYRGRHWISHTTSGASVPPLPEASKMRSDPNFAPHYPVGTPDEVFTILEPRLKDSRLTHFGFGFRCGGGMNTQAVRKSMDLFAKELLPTIKSWGRNPE